MKLSSVKKGQAAELILQARCTIAGLDCYPSTSADNKVDMVIGPNLKRVQVKLLGAQGMNVRKVSCNSKTNTKIYRYSEEEIDCFVAVSLDDLSVYVIPMKGLTYRNKISASTVRKNYVANDLTFLA